jgi:hypothetical protein
MTGTVTCGRRRAISVVSVGADPICRRPRLTRPAKHSPINNDVRAFQREEMHWRIMDEARRWRIGELADELGVSTRTLRFYEQIGLVKPAREGGRFYTLRDQRRLMVILKAKRLASLFPKYEILLSFRTNSGVAL